MVFAIAYNVFMLLSCEYAALCGGYWERWGAALMFGASMLTTGVVLAVGEYGTIVFLIDLAVLAALLFLAVRSDRLWPLWATGFHCVGVATHAAVLANSAIAPMAKAHALGLWSYLALTALAIGAWLYRKEVLGPVHGTWKRFFTLFAPIEQENGRGA